MRKYEYYIGIDPGVTTGVALWEKSTRQLLQVQSMPIHDALEKVKNLAHGLNALVRIEDARKRRWFGNTGSEVWKGAGSIMRDCKIWEDFLTDRHIDFELVAPRHNKTKVTHDYFVRLTKWTKPTNEHARDAALLVFGL